MGRLGMSYLGEVVRDGGRLVLYARARSRRPAAR
jgi:hypothetical protein